MERRNPLKSEGNPTLPLSAFVSPSVLAEVRRLHEEFFLAKPFKHIVIDNFLVEEVADRMLEEFPAFDSECAVNEHGVVGGKATQHKVRGLGETYECVDDMIASTEFRTFVGEIVGIKDLVYDPTYFGGGTHENRHGQELDPHVDFNLQHGTRYHRRLNLIVYLNREWKNAWGGQIEIHSDPRRPESNEIKQFDPIFNRCIIFETNEFSWHGFPKIRLPSEAQHLSRKSFAIYYYTKSRPISEVAPEHGTFYVPRPLRDEVCSRIPEPEREEVASALKRRDEWIRFYQRKELEWRGMIERTQESIGQLMARISPPLGSGLRFLGKASGLFPDYWMGREFSCDLSALAEINLILLSLFIPDNRKDIAAVPVSIWINDQPMPDAPVAGGRIVIFHAAGPGARIGLRVAFGRTLTPKDLGEGPDERHLSFILKSISAC